MENNTLFSVIMPAHNAMKTIRSSIESVLSQTYPRWELIVVDDGSTDGTSEAIKNFLGDNRVNYLHQSNKGASSARNTGIKASCGNYVAFLDSDDHWAPTKLAITLQHIISCPRAGLFYSDVLVIDETGRVLWANDRIRYNSNVYYQLIEADFITTSSVVVQRKCLDQVGYFSIEYQSGASCEDWDLWLRIAKAYPVEHVPYKLTFYSRKSNGPDEVYFQDYQHLLKKFVDSNDNLPNQVRRKAYANYYYVRGRGALLDLDYQNARHYFMDSLSFFPWTLKYYLFLGVSYFNQLIPRTIKKLLKVD